MSPMTSSTTDFLATGRRVIRREAEALEMLAEGLDGAFADAVDVVTYEFENVALAAVVVLLSPISRMEPARLRSVTVCERLPVPLRRSTVAVPAVRELAEASEPVAPRAKVPALTVVVPV